jgi:beta-glucanase (GH16 family)
LASAEHRPRFPSLKTITWSGRTTSDGRLWTSTDVRDDAQQTPDAITTESGYLRITTFTRQQTNYTGFISTQNIYEPKYGFYEARIRFHDSPGEWCAFWLESDTIGDPVGDPALAGVETDIAEHRACLAGGEDIRNKVVMNLHWDGYGADHKTIGSAAYGPAGLPLQGHWHTYAVLWTPDAYTFYLDGRQTWQTSAAVSEHPEHILLTCEVRNYNWAGLIPQEGYGDLGASDTGMDVAWVRVWQLERR